MPDIFPEVVCAAHWWADQLRKRDDQDAGDGFNSFMLEWARGKVKPPTEEQIEKFEQVARRTIQELIERNGFETGSEWFSNRKARRILTCDYHPCDELDTAAEEAGIDTLYFPVKTVMWIDPGSVRVRCGYYARDEMEIFANAEEGTP